MWVRAALPVAPQGLPSPTHMAKGSWEMKGVTLSSVSPSGHMAQSCAPELHSLGLTVPRSDRATIHVLLLHSSAGLSSLSWQKTEAFQPGSDFKLSPPPLSLKSPLSRKTTVSPGNDTSLPRHKPTLHLFQQLIICELNAAEKMLRHNGGKKNEWGELSYWWFHQTTLRFCTAFHTLSKEHKKGAMKQLQQLGSLTFH